MDKFTDMDDPTRKAGSEWKEQASSAAEEVREQAARVMEPLKQQARDAAEQQKEAGAEQIGGVARAVHGAADELEKELPHAARYVHEAADRLERASSALRERSVDDLFRSVSDFARKQPATFFASAVFAGFALSRFLKSSAQKQG
jgi:methyl-accepting chemotaxis protein